jgi:CMP-N-acetylneuraminic acid synthetase
LVFIGARGGSKGVKGKNLRPLAGKPLIAHSIEQALRWGRAERVVVSTDSEEIAEVARRHGAETPFLRPPHLATDTAPIGPAIRHALETCEATYGGTFDVVVHLQPTAPVRTSADLDACLDLFRRTRPSVVFSVVPAHQNPYFNVVEVGADGRVRRAKEPPRRIWRRQDAPPVYVINGSIYLYARSYVLGAEDPHPFTDDARIHVMDEAAGVDVDGELDLRFLEFLVQEGIVAI